MQEDGVLAQTQRHVGRRGPEWAGDSVEQGENKKHTPEADRPDLDDVREQVRHDEQQLLCEPDQPEMDVTATKRKKEGVVEHDVVMVDAEDVLALFLLDVALVVFATLVAVADECTAYSILCVPNTKQSFARALHSKFTCM